jgi:transposase-like protein
MSDTMQIVQWTLEHSCPLRAGEAIRDPLAASSAVGDAHHVGRTLSKTDGRFGIFGGIYVTSVTMATLPQRLGKGRSAVDHLLNRNKNDPCGDYPNGGEIVSEMFKEVGGIAGLRAMCRDCPVNVGRPLPAGCVGRIWQRPWSEETQEHLESIISRLGLAPAIAEHFLPTTPIWFGLWARSPLSPQAAGYLITLLNELAQARKDDGLAPGWREEFDQFLAAARIAEAGHATLHVEFLSPGHMDLGWHTIYPHCPRCKTEAELPRWKRKYPVAHYACKVCGQSYSPAEQHSASRMKSPERPDLRKMLGAEAFRAFARQYLLARGMSPADAVETVELSEAAEIQRQANFARTQRESEAHWRYIEQSLYAGLRLESLIDPDDPEAVLAKGFRSVDFDKLLRRAAERGIKTVSMSHSSTSEEMDRHISARMGLPRETKEDFAPLDVFQKWKTEGCDGIFAAHFKVPEALIDAFEPNRPT